MIFACDSLKFINSIGSVLLSEVADKVKTYGKEKGYSSVTLLEIEDNRKQDTANRRLDIEVGVIDGIGRQFWQKLLMLKDEIIDGEEFHRRFKEFYPD